jgi:hypothetical protein
MYADRDKIRPLVYLSINNNFLKKFSRYFFNIGTYGVLD